MEGIDPNDNAAERNIDPVPHEFPSVEVRGQSEVMIEEIPLLLDEEAMNAIRLLQQRGYSQEDIAAVYETLQPIPTTRVRERQAMRGGLDMRVRTEAARVLAARGINPQASDLDRNRLGRTNLIVMKAAIDRHVNLAVGVGAGQRSDLSRAQLDEIDRIFVEIVESATNEVFNGH